LSARYDAAVTNDDNTRHWANADGLDANAAASPGVRNTLRKRARYEFANSAYCSGIIRTLAEDLIGTGPTLHIQAADQPAASDVERHFAEWAAEIDLAAHLRTMRQAKAVDGEAFALFISNPQHESPVTLDLRMVEADQIATPNRSPAANSIDGIEYDRHGNPARYHVLRNHPGGEITSLASQYDKWPADLVLHLFRVDRPGQRRGVTELAPSLELFAQLRRFISATLSAAETAALFSGVMKSTGPADADPVSVEAMDSISLERNMLLTLPSGWDMHQMKAEHPNVTFDSFIRRIVNEAARPWSMPLNIALGSSEKSNYASGRLDHQTFWKAQDVERSYLDCQALNRIKTAWLAEARLIPGFLPPRFAHRHAWRWPGRLHIDPMKAARAASERLTNNTTTLRDEWAKQGKDWRQEIKQRGEEIAALKAAGVPVEDATAAVQASALDFARITDAAADQATEQISENILDAEFTPAQ
jgi:lambda family phage portal protein